MVMRWLTREWANGSLSEADFRERARAERRHRESVLSRLPASLRTLSGDPVDGRYRSLHDGRINSWELRLPDRFILELTAGDRQYGYERLRLEYRDVELLGVSEQQLDSWFNDESTELLYDEVDVAGDGRFEHRVLLTPDGEFGVSFGSRALTATDVDHLR
jgi:hypothetical protein